MRLLPVSGTGENTTKIKDITTFPAAGWKIGAPGSSALRNSACIRNIVDDVTYRLPELAAVFYHSRSVDR